MEDKYLILSDIHGNVSAFDAVLTDCRNEFFAGIVLLGDLIDYGIRSNEIIQKLKQQETGAWEGKIVVNIWGNHEKITVDKDLGRLSSDRGRSMADYTAKHLSSESVEYIHSRMNRTGVQEFKIGGMKCLAVHGSLEDKYWKAIEPQNLRGEYAAYNLVFSGHSHNSHAFSHFYPADDPALRNRKAVIFVNPGSVGQPRNQNPYAQYAVVYLPSKRIELRSVKYNVAYEQSLYPIEVDEFYKTRLARGV